MRDIGGNCGKCGAPYYVESPWFGINPPPPQPTCGCWNLPLLTTQTASTFLIEGQTVNPRIDDEPKLTAKRIAWLLAARHDSPFHVRKQFAVVSNVSWGLIPWEADLLVCSKAKYLTEVEIKISMSDWRADKAKKKWGHQRKLIKNFYYAAPPEIAERWEEIGDLPAGAGVLSVAEHGGVKILKASVPNDLAKPMSENDAVKLVRLGSMKAWKVTREELSEEASE